RRLDRRQLLARDFLGPAMEHELRSGHGRSPVGESARRGSPTTEPSVTSPGLPIEARCQFASTPLESSHGTRPERKVAACQRPLAGPHRPALTLAGRGSRVPASSRPCRVPLQPHYGEMISCNSSAFLTGSHATPALVRCIPRLRFLERLGLSSGA